MPAASSSPVPLVMRVVGDRSAAFLDVWTVMPGRRTVVFDIDGTLTPSDKELIKTLVNSGNYKPAVRPGAKQVECHEEGYPSQVR